MVCDTNSKVKNLLHCYSQTPSLRVMVVMAEIDEECRELALNTGIKMMQFTELEVSFIEHMTGILYWLFMQSITRQASFARHTCK